jgi:hypothetical protein
MIQVYTGMSSALFRGESGKWYGDGHYEQRVVVMQEIVRN